MNSFTAITPTMPDVTKTQEAELSSTLDWVGMKGISAPITLKDASGQLLSDNAKLQVYVNINDPKAKGIHMSRLYVLLEDFANNTKITAQDLDNLLVKMLHTHIGISDSVQIIISCNALLQRAALKSDNTGWKSYPLKIKAVYANDIFTIELGIKIPYSSSCPCSAALSRQLLQHAFEQEFSGAHSIDKNTLSEWLLKNGSLAIPHSQRSYADIWVKLNEQVDALPIIALIDACESALKTPVQTAVKREDEQEFARLNGRHQQFCEDAARQLKAMLDTQTNIQDYWLQVDHQESLHAHDAVAITTKGVKNGYHAQLFFPLP
jgi:GTP cyclohydrolase IB